MENKDTLDAVDMAIRRDVRAAVASDATLCILEGFLLLHDDELMAPPTACSSCARRSTRLGRRPRAASARRTRPRAAGSTTTAPCGPNTSGGRRRRWSGRRPMTQRCACSTRSWRRRLPRRGARRAGRAAAATRHTPARTRRSASPSMCAQSRGAAAPWANGRGAKVAALARRQGGARSVVGALAARARQRRGRCDRAAARRGGRGDDGAPPAAAQWPRTVRQSSLHCSSAAQSCRRSAASSMGSASFTPTRPTSPPRRCSRAAAPPPSSSATRA